MDTQGIHPTKTRNQLRRAHKLVAILSDQPECCCDVTCLSVARNLAPDGWVQLAGLAGIAPPSETTIAMAIGILEARVADDTAAGRALAAAVGMDEPRQADASLGYRSVMARIAPLPEDPFAGFPREDALR